VPALAQRLAPAASAAAARLASLAGSRSGGSDGDPGWAHPSLAFLLMSSVLPIVKVLMIAAMGLISALPFFDVLNKESRHSLSKVPLAKAPLPRPLLPRPRHALCPPQPPPPLHSPGELGAELSRDRAGARRFCGWGSLKCLMGIGNGAVASPQSPCT